MDEETVILYSSVGPKEFEILKENEFTKWPPLLSDQPIFSPVTNREFAEQIAQNWEVRASDVAYVIEFSVRASFMAKYPIHQVGGKEYTEWWIPAEDLNELNANIVGKIKIVCEFKAENNMKLDQSHPLNQRLLEYMQNDKGIRYSPEPIVSLDKHPDPYMEAGCHPDIVEHVWDTLGSLLLADCRALIYGTPALVHPYSGVVFAMASGTRYLIRVPDEFLQEALELGCETEVVGFKGKKWNVEDKLGQGWVFGCGAKEEKQWLVKIYNDLEFSEKDREQLFP